MEDIQKPDQAAAPEVPAPSAPASPVSAPVNNVSAPVAAQAQQRQIEAFMIGAQAMGLIYGFLRKRPHEEVDDLITLIKNSVKPIYKEETK